MGARVIFVSANTRSKTGDAMQLGREYHMSNIRMRARAAKTRRSMRQFLMGDGSGQDEGLAA